MKHPTAQEWRAQLDFEQQARFDALYDQRKKQQGAATGLSMPLLGTFGLEQFYLGNTARGVLSVLFCWTLIPTVSALFDVFSGDLKRQVAHANNRVAKQVYDNVIRNTVPGITPATPLPAQAVAAAPVAVPAMPAADPAPAATVVVADIPATAMTPVASVVAVTEAQETVAQVAETEAATVTTTEWHAGMNAPETTSTTETTTFSAASDVVTTATAATVVEAAPALDDPRGPLPVTAAPDLATAFIATDAPAEAEPLAPAQVEADAQPLLDSDILAADGVLVFMEDPSAVAGVTVAETQVQATQVSETATAQTTRQSFVDGALVDASASGVTISGEINTLLADNAHETLLVSDAAPHANWVDVSPLSADSVADSGSGSQSGTNVPGGGLGNPGTNVPGGGLGNPAAPSAPSGEPAGRAENGPIKE